MPLSPELRYEIRLAFTRRDILLDLMGTNFPPARLPCVPEMEADPERAAVAIREHLGITVADQRGWRSPDVALRRWREALERIGILVFQTTRIDVGEMRGFSIWHERLPVVLINGADAPSGRCFSALHELCHLILRDGGLCLPGEEAGADQHEVICNRIAGATLVPAAVLVADQVVLASAANKTWTDDQLRSLARTYSVSREMILRRLLILGRTARDRQGDHQGQPEEGRAQGQNRREDGRREDGPGPQAGQARRQGPEAGGAGRIEEKRRDRIAQAQGGGNRGRDCQGHQVAGALDQGLHLRHDLEEDETRGRILPQRAGRAGLQGEVGPASRADIRRHPSGWRHFCGYRRLFIWGWSNDPRGSIAEFARDPATFLRAIHDAMRRFFLDGIWCHSLVERAGMCCRDRRQSIAGIRTDRIGGGTPIPNHDRLDVDRLGFERSRRDRRITLLIPIHPRARNTAEEPLLAGDTWIVFKDARCHQSS